MRAALKPRAVAGVRAVRGDLTTGTTVGIMIEGSVIAEDDQMWICVILPDQIWHSTLM